MKFHQTSAPTAGKRRPLILRVALATLLQCLVLIVFSVPARALNYSLGDVDINLNNRLSAGAAIRVEERDPKLIGKLNLDPELCAEDDCASLSGDPAANQRLVDAPGSYVGHAQDDGNLNYDPGDLVSGLVKLRSKMTLNWQDYQLTASGIAFYDFVNSDFDETHPNTRYQPATTARDARVEELVGNAVELYDLHVAGQWYLGDRSLSATLGQQNLRWGESGLIALNAINEINPVDARRSRQPGTEIQELFQPVPMLVFSGDLMPDWDLSAEAFYQFGWRPVIADPAGSYMSSVDNLYRENSAEPLGLGNRDEDPDMQARNANQLAAMLTQSSYSIRTMDEKFGYPEDGGQYGLRINGYADNVGEGLSYSLYAMNYHSRYPYASFFAADRSCLRDAAAPGLVAAAAACEGFPVLGGREPLPIDTAQVFFDYPEDIQMYGLSFNTTGFGWSFAGELSYRPNLPVQVSITDLIFAALQPAFPEQDLVIGTDTPLDQLFGLPGLPNLPIPVTVPGARSAVPDFVATGYRGHDVQAGDYIAGYERLGVGQIAINGLKILGPNSLPARLIATDQIIFVAEVGATHIVDMPELEQIQFDSGSPNRTHYSPGADGSGTADGEPDTRRINPTQQTESHVTEWSWGYRLVARAEYNDLIDGAVIKPLLLFAHDVEGYAPKPMQNFLEDRMEWVLGAEAVIGQRWTTNLLYKGYAGNRHNSLRDRDHVLVDVNYSF